MSLFALIWYALATIGILLKIRLGESKYNNFRIFRQVFWHTINGTNLYSAYPSEYFDTNHYGPFFSVPIAPFAVVPPPVGVFFWCMANAAILLYAIRQLPLTFKGQNVILLIAAIEMMTSIQNAQFNCIMTSWIILSYTLVQKEKDFWAVFFIVAGTLVKLYGIVGISFFLFSKHKEQFLISFIFWLAVLFFIPVLISSFSYIAQSYVDWYHALAGKNAQNVINKDGSIDLSVMGLIDRIFKIHLSNITVLIPAAVLYLLPMLRFNQYKSTSFRVNYLALLLIGVVIFSSSAESPTYIIAMTGVGIWFVLSKKNTLNIALLIFALVLTSLSSTDLIPRSLKLSIILPYGLKTLPCFFIWAHLLSSLITKNFEV
ncbi:MAG: glycosyltransferase family 87 protein [Ginsengibacter sp.]